MKKLLLLMLLTWEALHAGEVPNFKVSEILVLQDGFIALKIENASAQDYPLPEESRDKVFLSLSINGIKRAEYLAKAVDPIIFLKHSFIVFKTNFRSGLPQRIRVEVNPEKALPESEMRDNILEKVLPPLN
jgi:hypothetical protein